MIPLGVLASRRPAAAGGVVITESFNQANSSTVGPDLTWTQVTGSWSTSGNRLSLAAAVGTLFRSMRAEHDMSSPDHYAQIVITGLSNSSDSMRIGAAVRFAPAADTYYAASYGFPASSPDDDLIIYKCVGGTITTLASTTSPPSSALPMTVRLEVEGTDLTCLIDGSPALTASDSSIATGSRTGVVGNRRSSGSPWAADDFEAGDL